MKMLVTIINVMNINTLQDTQRNIYRLNQLQYQILLLFIYVNLSFVNLQHNYATIISTVMEEHIMRPVCF